MGKYEIVDGIYEEIISEKIDKILSDIPEECKDTKEIDPSLAPEIFSNYVSDIVKKKLLEISEKSDDVQDQIIFVNNLLSSMSVDNMDLDLISKKGEQLRGVLTTDPLTKISNKKASDLVRPLTSISDSSLFTGTGREPNLSSELNKEIASSDEIDMMVSFIRWSGVRLIYDELKKFTESGKKLRIISTSYMGATELKAIDLLSKLKNTEIKISYDSERTRLHAKVYIFKRNTGYSTAYVGSSNLTAPAMTSGCEWNVKVTNNDLPNIFKKISASYEGNWNSQDYSFYTDDSKDKLREALSKDCSNNKINHRKYFLDVHPYPYQQAILDKLEAERKVHNSYKNLICSATGTGKTIISAFDYQKQCEREGKRLKLLFVAHRREILEQSIECYRDVLKDSEFGDLLFSGTNTSQTQYLFASIDSINSKEFTKHFDKDYFEYIVMDECHHSAAETYTKLLEYFEPKFLIGLTATPERMDGKNILEYFNNRIAAEIRLPEAINRKLLCPFQYFGVEDNIDLSELKWTRGGYDRTELSNAYIGNKDTADKRVELIVRAIYRYADDIDNIKGLIFCVSIEHAKYMSDKLNELGIPTHYLSGKSNPNERIQTRKDLIDGKIKFICAVDIYNEGVDIKEINTVLFLRPTESLTIFLQQLGRGLRLSKGKDCLTVLDFIGQANKRYSFENKFNCLMQTNNQGILREIKDDFPHLPKGCFIKLEKKSKEYIFSNIKNSLRGKNGLIDKIKNFEYDTSKKSNIKNFLNYYNLEAEAVYSVKYKITFTSISEPDIAFEDKDMWKKMYRLCSVDSVVFIEYIIKNLDNVLDIELSELSIKELYFWKMFYSTFSDGIKPTSDENLIDLIKDYWRLNYNFIPEVKSLLSYKFDKIDFEERDSNLPFENVLNVYNTYTRSQALSLLDYWNVSSEGVTRVKDKKATCLFITLNKGNSYYSPTTAYSDYSINENLFHWQSQNSTAPNTSVGMRYINHKKNGENILLFVREQKDNYYGPSPFMFLGKANFVSYEGEKPMNIVWELENRIPAKFINVTDKLGVE